MENILNIKPYSLGREDKRKILGERLNSLTRKHYGKCAEYKIIMDTFEKDCNNYELEKFLYLPVGIFKDMELKSIANDEIVKIMTSSGTTGQKTSKIFLDKNTSSNQQKVLVKIVSEFTGKSRLPMLIIDSPSVIKNR